MTKSTVKIKLKTLESMEVSPRFFSVFRLHLKKRGIRPRAKTMTILRRRKMLLHTILITLKVPPKTSLTNFPVPLVSTVIMIAIPMIVSTKVKIGSMIPTQLIEKSQLITSSIMLHARYNIGKSPPKNIFLFIFKHHR